MSESPTIRAEAQLLRTRTSQALTGQAARRCPTSGPGQRSQSRTTIEAMTPPEVVLDRIVRNELRHEDGCSGYSGKLDIDRIGPESLRSFLHLVQRTMN